jgi:hypothetical protein
MELTGALHLLHESARLNKPLQLTPRAVPLQEMILSGVGGAAVGLALALSARGAAGRLIR